MNVPAPRDNGLGLLGVLGIMAAVITGVAALVALLRQSKGGVLRYSALTADDKTALLATPAKTVIAYGAVSEKETAVAVTAPQIGSSPLNNL